MTHKEGPVLEKQRLRRLLLLKYSWEARDLKQLALLTNIPRGVVYRFLNEDSVFETVIRTRLAGKPSPLTEEELLAAEGDKTISHIPTLREIVKDVLAPYESLGLDEVKKMDRPMITELPTQYKVVAIDPVLYTDDNDAELKIKRAETICELIANGSTTNQACEILSVKTTTFLGWVNPAGKNFIKEISDMYSIAKSSFNSLMDEETHMVAKQALRQLVEGRTIKLQTKIGRVQKDGVIKTTQIKETEKIVEPNFGAVAKVLTTREAAKYGTPEERKNLQLENKGDNYELRAKSLEELDLEEARLLEQLNGKKD